MCGVIVIIKNKRKGGRSNALKKYTKVGLDIKIETLKVVFYLVTRSNNGIQDHTTA
jgi:hypothetical protein